MAVANGIGTAQPLSETAALREAAGSVFHTCGASAEGVSNRCRHVWRRPVSLWAHKRGGLRSGTLPTPLCVGFGEACRILAHERDSDANRLHVLRGRFLAELLRTVPGLAVKGQTWSLAAEPANGCFGEAVRLA